ncbi:hypothetical protein DRO61_00930, partial [Candidatus Bathyarchaeota archaeon]
DKYKADLVYGVKQGRIFGGAAGLLLIDTMLEEDELKDRIDYSKITAKSKMSIFTRDRWNGLEYRGAAMEKEDIGTTDFGKTEIYGFLLDSPGNTTAAGKRFDAHHTHVLRFGNRKPPKFTQYQLSGWDLPEGQHIYAELTRDETTRAAVASLIAKSVLEVIHMEGMQGLFSGIAGGNDDEEAQAQKLEILQAKLEMVTRFRNNNSLTFLDKDDIYEQFQISNLSGLAEILNKQQDNVSGAVEIPRVILYGETKGGIGSDQPAELVIYSDTINAKQEEVVRPLLNKLLPILFRMAGSDMPIDTTFIFLPIFEKSDDDKQTHATKVVDKVTKLLDYDLILPSKALEEVRQSAKYTNFGTNFTAEDVTRLQELEAKGIIGGSGFTEEEADKQVKKEKEIKDGKAITVMDATKTSRKLIFKSIKKRSK